MEKCENILQLPNEILAEILGKLKNNQDKLICRQVCKRFLEFFNFIFGVKDIALGKQNFSLICEKKIWTSLSVLDKIGINSCLFGDILKPPGDEGTLKFAFPKSLKKLEIVGSIPLIIFKSLFNNVHALKIFSIHFQTLKCLNLDPNEKIFEFPVLKTFQVSSRKVESNKTTYRILQNVINNLIIMLNNLNSSNLRNLYLDIPHLLDREVELTMTIFKCIDKHRLTLRDLDMFWSFTFETNEFDEEDEDENLDINEDMDINELDEADEQGAGGDGFYNVSSNEDEEVKEIICNSIDIKILEKIDWMNGFGGKFLHRICFSAAKNMTTYKIWRKFLSCQKNLSEVFFMNESTVNSNTGKFLLENRSLKKILLQLNENQVNNNLFILGDHCDGMPLDCKIFASSPNISHLLIRGRTLLVRHGVNVSHTINVRSNLINEEFLPRNLTVLSLREIYIDIRDIDKIIRRFALEKLRLVDIGQNRTYGMGPETFWHIVENQTIKEVEIIRGFNRMSCLSIQSRSAFKKSCVMSKISQHYIDSTLHIRLEKVNEGESNCEYFNVIRPMFDYPNQPSIRPHQVCDIVFS